MPGRYANKTNVSTTQSRAEIQDTLKRYGATGFREGWNDVEDGRRVEQIDFVSSGKLVRFTLVTPAVHDREFRMTRHKKPRKASDRERDQMWQQTVRQRWRALALCVKAKLEAVEVGISTFEEEFLANIVDPKTGRTMSQDVLPQIDNLYKNIGGPVRLPGLPDFTDGKTA